MFVLLGGALSFIVGLVGVLNFFNAIFTGIITAGGNLRCSRPSA